MSAPPSTGLAGAIRALAEATCELERVAPEAPGDSIVRAVERQSTCFEELAAFTRAAGSIPRALREQIRSVQAAALAAVERRLEELRYDLEQVRRARRDSRRLHAASSPEAHFVSRRA